MQYAIYTCGNCDKVVSKSTRVCPHCRVSLAGIRCKACSFVGGEKDFANDLCPRCGARVVRPANSEAEFSWSGCLVVLGVIAVLALLYYFGVL